MRNLFIVITCLLACNIAAQETKKTTEFNINIGYDFGLKEGSGGAFTFQPEYGIHFNENFYLGFGTGFATDKFKNFAIPLFLRTEVDFPTKTVIPYISLQGGYDFAVTSATVNSTRINPAVGVKVPISSKVLFNLGFGYTRSIVKGGGYNSLGFKAGVCFNSAGSGFVKAMQPIASFFKSLDYNVELETMTPTAKATIDNADHKEDIKYAGLIGVRFSGIAPLSWVENLYAGLSVGAGHYKEKVENLKYDTAETWGYFYLNLMARARYKAKQIIILDKIYPFAQADLGFTLYDEFKFTVNPAVGISIMTSDKQSIDLSVGYTSIPVYDSTKGSLRIAVGYTF